MKTNRVKTYLIEIFNSLEEIESFKTQISESDDKTLRLMATRAAEREFEVIGKNYEKIQKLDDSFQLRDIDLFIKIYERLSTAYLDKTDATLIWSVIENKLELLKNEVLIKLTPVPVNKYLDKEINYKKPPLLYATVIESGNPNMVKVYITEDNTPVIQLRNYRNPMQKGKNILVEPAFSKKKTLVQVSFRKFFNGSFAEKTIT